MRLATPALVLAALVSGIGDGPQLTPEQLRIFRHMEVVELDDGFGNPIQTVRISGANLQVVAGPGEDIGDGTGNILVGWQDETVQGMDRRGIHNVIVGPRHSWLAASGLAVGSSHRLESGGSTALGFTNVTSGLYSTVLGGNSNEASFNHSTVVGGAANRAEYFNSVVLGGYANTASGVMSTVSGGRDNTAATWYSSISGGANNHCSKQRGVVAGGLSQSLTESTPHTWALGRFRGTE